MKEHEKLKKFLEENFNSYVFKVFGDCVDIGIIENSKYEYGYRANGSTDLLHIVIETDPEDSNQQRVVFLDNKADNSNIPNESIRTVACVGGSYVILYKDYDDPNDPDVFITGLHSVFVTEDANDEDIIELISSMELESLPDELLPDENIVWFDKYDDEEFMTSSLTAFSIADEAHNSGNDAVDTKQVDVSVHGFSIPVVYQ